MIGYAIPDLTGQVLPIRFGGRLLEIPLPAAGRTIGIIANWNSRRLARSLMRSCFRTGQPAIPLALPGLEWLMPDIRRSDHAYFWRRGLPAVMVTDTANFRNPHYHKSTDVPETLDFDFMGRITRAVADYVRAVI